MLNIFSLAGLLLAITCFLIAIIVLVYGRSKLHRIWLLCNIAICIWGIGCFLVGISKTEQEALFGWRLAHLGGVFIAVFFYHMACIFCEVNRKYVIIFAYIQIISFQILNLTSNLFLSSIKSYYGLFYAKSTGIYYPVAFIIWFILVFLGHVELIRFYFISQGIKRLQVKYIFTGFLVGFLGGTSTLLPIFGINIYPFGNFTIVLYPIIVSYAILKYRLLDLKIAFTRAGIFLVIYTLILGLPFLIAFKYGYWPLSLVLMAVLATLGPIGYRFLQKRAEDFLLAEQRRYQNILKQAAKGMSKQHDLRKLLKLIVYLVTKSVKINFAIIFLIDELSGLYQLRATRDHSKVFGDLSFKKDDPLMIYLKQKRDPVLVEELPPALKNRLGNEFINGLIVQSFTGEKMIGFMLLGEKKNGKMYSEDDIETFTTLSLQSSLAIENCLFVDELKENQGRIFAAEKLAAIGGMADGLAHQIRNRLNSFSVVAGEQDFEIVEVINTHAELLSKDTGLKKSLEYLLECSRNIQSNVKKTELMIRGILNFARVDDKSKAFANFSLRQVVETSVEAVKVKHQISDFPIKPDYGKDDSIYGVEIQIRECIYNVLDNAYEATKEKVIQLKEEEKPRFVPEIGLKLSQLDKASLIEIRDNGIGIKDENKQKIFSPFFTTKPSVKSGTGIGMYIVKRMIEENHSGKIRFDSHYGQGTVITLELPKNKA